MERMTFKELRNYLSDSDRLSFYNKYTGDYGDYINFRCIADVPKIFDVLCVYRIGITNREFPDLTEGYKRFPCIEIKVSSEFQQMIKTLNDLEYQCILENDKKIIYRKYIGIVEIKLELDIQTQKVKKYANDYMKKVEEAPYDIEVALMKKLID